MQPIGNIAAGIF